MKRKIFAVIMTGIMTLTLLAGCGAQADRRTVIRMTAHSQILRAGRHRMRKLRAARKIRLMLRMLRKVRRETGRH